MKTKILSSLLIAATIFTGYSAYNSNKERELTNVALSNVEALAGIEGAVGATSGNFVSFKFNGQLWHGAIESDVAYEYKWFPRYKSCEANGFYGHEVECILGSGDCWNGTNCI